MYRRQYLAAAASLTNLSLFAGCSSGGAGNSTSAGSGSPTSGNTPSSTDTATTTSQPTPSPAATTDQGTTTGVLPAAPAETTPGTSAVEFTTSGASTPMAPDAFTSTLEARIKTKNLSTAYYINTLPDERTVEMTYVADESTQRKALEAFAESFVEVVARTGGTGGWSLEMTVQTGADREVWYTWSVKNEWAVQRLVGEISRTEFYNKIENTTAMTS
jgi:hypothetical protein